MAFLTHLNDFKETGDVMSSQFQAADIKILLLGFPVVQWVRIACQCRGDMDSIPDLGGCYMLQSN